VQHHLVVAVSHLLVTTEAQGVHSGIATEAKNGTTSVKKQCQVTAAVSKYQRNVRVVQLAIGQQSQKDMEIGTPSIT
jgi:hypothetical protein